MRTTLVHIPGIVILRDPLVHPAFKRCAELGRTKRYRILGASERSETSALVATISIWEPVDI